jgi:hypothetical protein
MNDAARAALADATETAVLVLCTSRPSGPHRDQEPYPT